MDASAARREACVARRADDKRRIRRRLTLGNGAVRAGKQAEGLVPIGGALQTGCNTVWINPMAYRRVFVAREAILCSARRCAMAARLPRMMARRAVLPRERIVACRAAQKAGKAGTAPCWSRWCPPEGHVR